MNDEEGPELGTAADREAVAQMTIEYPPGSVDLVFSHDGCTDGRLAALMAHLANPDCLIVFRSPGAAFSQQELEVATALNVLMVDTAPASPADFDRLETVTKSVCVLDHHASNTAMFGDRPNYVGCTELSGASAAYYYVGKPKLGLMKKVIRYVQERDTWRWPLADAAVSKRWSLSLNAVLEGLDNTAALAKLEEVCTVQAAFDAITADPCGVIAKLDAGIAEIHAMAVEFTSKDGTPCMLVDLQGRSDLRNAVNDGCNSLARATGRSVIIAKGARKPGDDYGFSLRGPGCLSVALEYQTEGRTAGGHPDAAGFKLSPEDTEIHFPMLLEVP